MSDPTERGAGDPWTDEPQRTKDRQIVRGGWPGGGIYDWPTAARLPLWIFLIVVAVLTVLAVAYLNHAAPPEWHGWHALL